jgi:hypothetical protein
MEVGEFEAERERAEAVRRQEKERIEGQLEARVEAELKRVGDMRRDGLEREAELMRRHAVEVSQLKEKMKVEMEEWQRQMSQRLEKEAKVDLFC